MGRKLKFHSHLAGRYRILPHVGRFIDFYSIYCIVLYCIFCFCPLDAFLSSVTAVGIKSLGELFQCLTLFFFFFPDAFSNLRLVCTCS